MLRISYTIRPNGECFAKWPGRSVRLEDGPRKVGQVYLGRVVNRAENVFFKGELGYYRFDPDTLACTPVPQDQVPPYDGPPDARERRRPVCCEFGGSYLLDRIVSGIGYTEVLDKVKFGNRDTLMAVLQYYALEDSADCHAAHWYKTSYASYLYPRANVASQRVSDLLRALGSDDARRDFLEAHIRYLAKNTDDGCYVLVDSTGCPNACGVPITRYSNHNGVSEVEFRLIAVVQRSTGLPIWYEVIPGNVVDVATIDNVMRKLRNYGCDVVYVVEDAGYSCPSNMERLVLSGIDFVARMNPTYDDYKRVLSEHYSEISDPNDATNVVRYRGRVVRVVKAEAPIATDRETGEVVNGWVYLCRDLEAYHSKCDHVMSNAKKTRKMTAAEILAACERLGVFAIVSTRDLPPEELLPEYYARQGVEQLFDFAKGCGKMLPVRNHTEETIRGHMLLSFVATFLHVLVKNRMNVLDTHYVALPDALRPRAGDDDDGELVEVTLEDGTTTEMVLVQDPLASVLGLGSASVFGYAQRMAAEVFDREIVPCVPTAEVRDLYKAFGLEWPLAVAREGTTLTPLLKEGTKDRCRPRLAFAHRPYATDEAIEAKRADASAKKSGGKAGQEAPQANETGRAESAETPVDAPEADSATEHAAEAGETAGKPAEAADADGKGARSAEAEGTNAAPDAEGAKPRRRPGRPKGSKNKKTLEREAEERRLRELGLLPPEPPKRRRGRPPGSKNKKTLEREAAAREAAKAGKGA